MQFETDSKTIANWEGTQTDNIDEQTIMIPYHELVGMISSNLKDNTRLNLESLTFLFNTCTDDEAVPEILTFLS